MTRINKKVLARREVRYWKADYNLQVRYNWSARDCAGNKKLHSRFAKTRHLYRIAYEVCVGPWLTGHLQIGKKACDIADKRFVKQAEQIQRYKKQTKLQ